MRTDPGNLKKEVFGKPVMGCPPEYRGLPVEAAMNRFSYLFLYPRL